MAEVLRRLLAAVVVVPRLAGVPHRLRAVEVAHQLLAEVPHRLLVAAVVPQLAAAQSRLLALAVVPRLAEVQHRLLAADAAALRRLKEAAVVHPPLAALHQVAEELVAAMRIETPMTGVSILKSVGPPLGGATTEESGTGRNGTSGADDGTNTASVGAGSKPRSVSFGFAAELRLARRGALNRHGRGD